MEKLKYAGFCAAGFLLNCALVGIFFMLCHAPFYGRHYFDLYIEIQAVVTISVLHGVFRSLISKKLQMKTVVYTFSANVLPHVISIVILLLHDRGFFHSNEGYSGLAWAMIILILSFEIFVSGIGGFLFHKNVLRNM